MRSPFIRIGMAIATASVALLPLAANAQFSGTNGQIYFNYKADSAHPDQIAAANSDGTQSHVIMTPASGVTDRIKDVSPDGSKILYQEIVTGGTNTFTYSLKIANADGSGATTVAAPSGAQIYNGRFSAGGTTVYFQEQGNSVTTNDGIYSVPVTGGTPTPLILDSNPSALPYSVNYSPLVSATKMYLAVGKQSVSGNALSWEIDSSNLDGTGLIKIYTPANTAILPEIFDVSPDGTKLLIRDNDLGHLNLFSISATDGSGAVDVSKYTTADVNSAFFSPDGTKVIYGESNGNTDLGTHIRNADGSGTETAVWTTSVNATWSSRANAVSGTYTSPLIGAIGGGTSPTPTLTPARTVTTVVANDSQPAQAVTIAANNTLIVDGARGDITVQSGGILGGHGGTVGNVTVQSGGHLAPGGTPGCINSGNVTLVSGANFDEDITGAAVCTEYSQQKVTGTVDLGNATLNVTLSYVPTAGTKFKIIDNDLADPITGTFAGLASGATVTANGYDFTISYTGGDGNDVELTAVGPATVPALPPAALVHTILPIALGLLAIISVFGIEITRRKRSL